MGLFLPRGFQKPPVGARINWTHPLAAGLGLCYVLNEQAGTPYDLVAGTAATLGGSAAWAGGAVRASSGGIDCGDYGGWDGSTSWTIVVGQQTLVSLGDRRIAGTWYSGNFSRLVTISGSFDITVAVHDGGGAQVASSSSTYLGDTAARTIGAGQNGATELVAYYDGVNILTQAISASVPANVAGSLAFGADPISAGNTNSQFADIFHAYVWPTRCLRASEHAWLAAEPYAFLTR